MLTSTASGSTETEMFAPKNMQIHIMRFSYLIFARPHDFRPTANYVRYIVSRNSSGHRIIGDSIAFASVPRGPQIH